MFPYCFYLELNSPQQHSWNRYYLLYLKICLPIIATLHLLIWSIFERIHSHTMYENTYNVLMYNVQYVQEYVIFLTFFWQIILDCSFNTQKLTDSVDALNLYIIALQSNTLVGTLFSIIFLLFNKLGDSSLHFSVRSNSFSK